MPTEVVLRLADEGEGPDLARVQLAARAAAPMPPPIHDAAAVESWLAGRLQDDDVWVAEVDRRVGAYVRLRDAWLDDLYVAPQHARQGIGSALLDLAKAQRPGGFCLWVFETNTPAREFYARHGLVELERTDGSANEEGAPDLRLAWPGREPLLFLRGLIDDVDVQLGELLARRAALTRAVQPHKTDPSRDAARERRIAEAMATQAPSLGADRLSRIVDVIITESLDAAASP